MPDNIAQNTELAWKMFVFLFGLVLSVFGVMWGLIKTGSKLIFGNQILRINRNESRIDEVGMMVSKCQSDNKKDLTELGSVCNNRFDTVTKELQEQNVEQNVHRLKTDMILENLLKYNKEFKEHSIKVHEENRSQDIRNQAQNKKLQEQIINLLTKQLDKE